MVSIDMGCTQYQCVNIHAGVPVAGMKPGAVPFITPGTIRMPPEPEPDVSAVGTVPSVRGLITFSRLSKSDPAQQKRQING